MIPFLDKKYSVVYADPPWRYTFSKSHSRKVENQYQTLSPPEIILLSPPTAKKSVLYLWATAPKLKEALHIMEAWGFEYKTHSIWDKEIMGMGYWFRGQHELLLVGTKGSFSPPEPALRVSSVVRIRRGTHSRKPTKIRDLLVKWFPTALRLEMFAREPAEGWDSWGLEV